MMKNLKPIHIILIIAALAVVAWLWYDHWKFNQVMAGDTRSPLDVMADAITRRNRLNPDLTTPLGDGEIVTWEGNRSTILQSDLRRRV